MSHVKITITFWLCVKITWHKTVKEAPYLSFRLATRRTQEEGSEAPTSPGPVSRHLILSALTVPTEATFPSSLRESSHPRDDFSSDTRADADPPRLFIQRELRQSTRLASRACTIHARGHASTHDRFPFVYVSLSLSRNVLRHWLLVYRSRFLERSRESEKRVLTPTDGITCFRKW